MMPAVITCEFDDELHAVVIEHAGYLNFGFVCLTDVFGTDRNGSYKCIQ